MDRSMWNSFDQINGRAIYLWRIRVQGSTRQQPLRSLVGVIRSLGRLCIIFFSQGPIN